jgi:hypothetical protein
MGKRRHNSGPHRRRVATQRGYTICTVDASEVRSLTRADEEFTNFATHDDLPALVPAREIWIDARLFESEGIFSIANALVRLSAREAGASEDRAYDAGLDAERALRERLFGVEYRDGKPHRRVPGRIYAGRYATLPDERGPIEVRLVEGDLVRAYYKTDYCEGGHGYVYRWVPRGQIWVERSLDRGELPYVVGHEYTELRLMRDRGMEYDPAHEIAAKVEFALREGDHLRDLVAPGRRAVSKRDLPRLTSPEYFAAVLEHYKDKGR